MTSKRAHACVCLFAATVFLSACAPVQNANQSKEAGMTTTFKITSDAFSEGAAIPIKYTCDDRDVSPPLRWGDAPAGTKSFALICDDPDAPAQTWVHWVLYDLPPSVAGLAEAQAKGETLDNGARQGLTDFGDKGYGGPCPPPGKPHRYYFKLYALDAMLGLPAGKTKQELLEAISGHTLAEASLMGTYKRK
jgi:Raf kinase inhibitor-like YbhB/YbcL family protein